MVTNGPAIPICTVRNSAGMVTNGLLSPNTPCITVQNSPASWEDAHSTTPRPLEAREEQEASSRATCQAKGAPRYPQQLLPSQAGTPTPGRSPSTPLSAGIVEVG